MIDTEQDSRRKVETAFLVGIRENDDDVPLIHEHLDELAQLLHNLDIECVGRNVASIKTASAQYYLGSGKAAEIAQLAQETEADCLVFDTPLSSSQQRNWEKLAHVPVLDREEIILDIFAERAATAEARLQVELAQLHYYLPRLTRAWSHLSRQRGGAQGTRGEGETQIETDRRLVKRRIDRLEKELETVKSQRQTGRKHRLRTSAVCGAIVGYTNVGKSSLLQALSGAGLLVEDKLFATLDPTTRRVTLPDKQALLLTDTVGFVRRLPHSLIDAFKSTLEEAILADFLILVLDISSPVLEEQWETTLKVLRELGAEEKNITVVFNKIDRLDPVRDAMLLARTKALFPDAVYVSIRTGENLPQLTERLQIVAASKRKLLHVMLPPERHDLAALAHAQGEIAEENYDDNGVLHLVFSTDEKYYPKFENFLE